MYISNEPNASEMYFVLSMMNLVGRAMLMMRGRSSRPSAKSSSLPNVIIILRGNNQDKLQSTIQKFLLRSSPNQNNTISLV